MRAAAGGVSSRSRCGVSGRTRFDPRVAVKSLRARFGLLTHLPRVSGGGWRELSVAVRGVGPHPVRSARRGEIAAHPVQSAHAPAAGASATFQNCA
ncbi:hypothetical protein GCM10023318_54670 [Nocardia callitridis]|uniref:Uncharacterized protein n=1 Tax=Nocardia callitridis TaxID=648753 RepID=A0ABP9KUW8_9NOCA